MATTADWAMVAYTDPDAREAHYYEGWMLVRTQRRLLLVPLQQADILDRLEGVKDSPAFLEVAEEDSGSEVEGSSGEEMTEEERKARRKAQRAKDKKKMRQQREALEAAKTRAEERAAEVQKARSEMGANKTQN